MGHLDSKILGSTSVAEFTLVEKAYPPSLKLPKHSHEQAYFCFTLGGNPEDVNEFRRDKWKMPWLHSFVGLKGGALKQFEVVGIPKTILVNRNGEIVATGVDLRGSRLSETLEQVFQSK